MPNIVAYKIVSMAMVIQCIFIHLVSNMSVVDKTGNKEWIYEPISLRGTYSYPRALQVSDQLYRSSEPLPIIEFAASLYMPSEVAQHFMLFCIGNFKRTTNSIFRFVTDVHICYNSLYRVYQRNWTNLKLLSGFVKRRNVRSFFVEIGCLGTDNVSSVNRENWEI